MNSKTHDRTKAKFASEMRKMMNNIAELEEAARQARDGRFQITVNRFLDIGPLMSVEMLFRHLPLPLVGTNYDGGDPEIRCCDVRATLVPNSGPGADVEHREPKILIRIPDIPAGMEPFIGGLLWLDSRRNLERINRSLGCSLIDDSQHHDMGIPCILKDDGWRGGPRYAAIAYQINRLLVLDYLHDVSDSMDPQAAQYWAENKARYSLPLEQPIPALAAAVERRAAGPPADRSSDKAEMLERLLGNNIRIR